MQDTSGPPLNSTHPPLQPSNLLRTDGFSSWRQAKVLDLMPIIILNTLYMLFGVIGNSVVCYICIFRLQRSVINTFVLWLAVVELFGCVVTIPVDITEIMNLFAFDYAILCKTERYCRKTVIFSTGCILVAIAAERYQRIVKPYQRHVTMTEVRYAVIGALSFSCILAIPEALLSGTETIITPYGSGMKCSTYHSDAYRGTVYPQLWGFVVVLVYIVSLSTIGVIYFIIASQIWKRGKVLTDRRSRPCTPDSTLRRRVRTHSTNSMCMSKQHQQHQQQHLQLKLQSPAVKLKLKLKHTGKEKHRYSEQLPTIQLVKGEWIQISEHDAQTKEHISSLDNSLDDSLIQQSERFHQDCHSPRSRATRFFEELIHNLKKHERNDKTDQQNIDNEHSFDIIAPKPFSPSSSVRRRRGYSRKRTTFIMFIMTLTSALSHFPDIVVMLYHLPRRGVEARLAPDLSVLFHFARNSFFISLACHPFVYGFWNGRFKMALLDLLMGFRKGKEKPDRESTSTNLRPS